MPILKQVLAVAVAFLCLNSAVFGAKEGKQAHSVSLPLPQLLAESSDFQESGNYAEVETFIAALSSQHSAAVRSFELARTVEGRPIRGMVVSLAGVLTAEVAKKKNIPVVLLIGGTHAGEIDGKDAGLLTIRDLLADPSPRNPLRKMVVLFVPVFNVDGHEHRDVFNRPNQQGPRVQGERLTASRINLNRDWILAQTPEMKGMLQLIDRWDPLVTADLHVLDGFKYRHDVSISTSSFWGMMQPLHDRVEDFHASVVRKVREMGHTPLPFYPELVDKEDPSLGVVYDPDTPRFSHVYATTRNRVGLLIEDYAWNDYKARVKVCRDTIFSILRATDEHANQLQRYARIADQNSIRPDPEGIALDWRNALDLGATEPDLEIKLRAYEYTIYADAPVIGGRQIVYHTDKPSTWKVPFFRKVKPMPESRVVLPEGGYLVPAAWAQVVRGYLQQHGIDSSFIEPDLTRLNVEEFRVEKDRVQYDAGTFQGRVRTRISGKWVPVADEDLPSTSRYLWIPSKQQRALLMAHLLEPSGPDSLSSWGIFNTAYEDSDFIAGHREMELAQWMYHQDPRAEVLLGSKQYKQLPNFRRLFDERVAVDVAFRNDPAQRLDFWMSRLPPFDKTFNRYPILRIRKAAASRE